MSNRVRFDGRSKRFYEVWYTIFNQPTSGDGFWIRYTLLNPLDAHPQAGAGLWFGYTCRASPRRSVALHRSFPSDAFDVVPGATSVRIGDAVLEEGRFRGGFETSGRSVRWDLRYAPSAEPHYYFTARLRRLAERLNSVTVPNPRILLDGEVVIDDERLEIRDAPGHQAHHWGTERAPRWNWGHCCAFDGEDAVLELLSAEGPAGIPVTFVSLYTPEENVLCNRASSLLFNRCVSGLGFWRFEGRSGSRRIVADVRVDPACVQKFVYVSPTYRKSECWNTQVGECLVRLYDGDGRLVRTLKAHGTAAAEIHDERPERIPYPAWLSERE